MRECFQCSDECYGLQPVLKLVCIIYEVHSGTSSHISVSMSTQLMQVVIREVWPGAEFGESGIFVDEEVEVMREILYNPVAGVCVCVCVCAY